MKEITVFINSLKQGGAEKVVVLLNKHLQKYFNINLLLLENENFFNVNDNIYILNENKVKSIKIISLFLNAYYVKKYVKKNNIRIIQSHLLRSNYINILSKLIGSKHQVQIVNHSLLDRFANTLKGRMHLLFMKILYKYADVSISVSKEVENQLLKYIKLPSKRYTIYNPIEYNLIRKNMEEDVDDFDFQKNIIYLIMVGRINSIKNIEMVIKLLNKIQNNNIHLILIGKEENVDIKSLLKLAQYPERIHYLGVQKNPYKYIYRSNILIVSSKSESFGNVLIESMACETVVISSDCGGPREILCANNCKQQKLTNGKIEFCTYGILYGIDDLQGLENAISQILQNPHLYQSYVKKGLQRAKEFNIDNIIKKYKKVLNENSN